ncbi:MAG: carcinine hydrolase/isopenicillin-N N-acyltransferase family protein [Myxococcaceae bacterium]
MVVVGSGGVLFAKNSDRDPNEAQVLDWQPRRQHPSGATVRCTYLEIPQVAQTHAVLLSRPFWMWGAEMGTNEHGVTIGNEAVFTTAGYANSGLTGMDLLRLALERASTAPEAVEVLKQLLATHGQGGGCGYENRAFTYHNSFIVADPREALVLETAAKEWAVEKVQGARSISNGLTIPAFAKKHADRLVGSVVGCAVRRAQTEAGVEKATSAAELMGVLRAHGPSAWPRYALVNGTLRIPCMHGGGVVASSQTTASWVADLSPGKVQHWVTGTSCPCLSLFKPVSVELPVNLGQAPGDQEDSETLWWAHERLHRTVLRAPEKLAPLFLEERDRVQQRWLAHPPSSEQAFAEARRLLASWSARVERAASTEDVRPFWVRRYWNKRDRMAAACQSG